MNVDEAIEIAASTAETVLATEVERLLAELAAAKAEIKEQRDDAYCWMMVAQDKERELAAVKAVSVCPVRVRSVWVDDIGGRVVAYCKNSEEAMKFEVWLRERMKQRGEG